MVEFALKVAGQMLITLLLVTRLSPLAFGHFTWLLMLGALLTLIASGGFDALLLTRGGQRRLFRTLHTHLLALKLAVFLPGSVLVFAFAVAPLPIQARVSWAIICLAVPPQFFVDQADIYLRAHDRFRQYRFRLVLGAICLGSKLAFLGHTPRLAPMLLVGVLEPTVLVAYYWVICPEARFCKPKLSFLRHYRRTLGYLWSSTLLTSMQFRLDHLLVQRIQGFQAYAVYAFAYKFFDGALALTGAWVRIDAPRFAAGLLSLRQFWSRTFVLGLAAGLAGLAFLALVVHTRLPQYAGSLPILALYFISLQACIFGMLRGVSYVRRNLNYYDVVNALVGLAILAVLSPLAQRAQGLNGAALAFMAACLCSGVVSTLWNPRGWALLRPLLRTTPWSDTDA